MLKSDFFRSAVLGAFPCDRSEYLNKCDVFGLGHYIGYAVGSNIGVCGCLVGCEVGDEVGALAHGSTGGLDLVAHTVGAFVVCEVVGFGGRTRQGVAEPLFSVLSVVAVLSGKIGCKCDRCHICKFLPIGLGALP